MTNPCDNCGADLRACKDCEIPKEEALEQKDYDYYFRQKGDPISRRTYQKLINYVLPAPDMTVTESEKKDEK